MNYLLAVLNILFTFVLYLSCDPSVVAGTNDQSYTYVLTEDAKLRPFGRIRIERGLCRPTFSLKSGYQYYVTVSSRTGILRLRRKLRFLRKDKDGIRRLTIELNVNRCLRSRYQYSYSTVTVTVKLIIFPLHFGDSFLERFDSRRISSMVRESDTFGKRKGSVATANSLHRFLRVVSAKIERKAFDEMFSAIKVEKAIEFAVKDIISAYTTKTESKNVYYSWYLNTLFSRRVLNDLARGCGCKRDPVIKCTGKDEYRTIDGSCNNKNYPLYGYAPNALNRLIPARYFDAERLKDPFGYPGQPLGPNIPAAAQVIRDFIEKQDHPEPNSILSHAVMQWGQFLDHDLDLSPESQSSDNCQKVRCDGSQEDYAAPCFTIEPVQNFRCIHFARSATKCLIKNGRITKRQPINVNTAWIDGSQVYGSTDKLAKNLRDFSNDKGLLRVQPGVNGDLLPADNSELMAPDNFCKGFGGCFLAGDTRSSEQQVLATMHTLLLREHNRLAKKLKQINPHWNGEKIYQETRKIVGAVLQKITYYDYLPMIIGNTLPEYRGYDPKVNPDIVNAFSSAAYRFGHSTVKPNFDRLDAYFNPTGDPIPLRFLFFNNTYIKRHGIDELLLGLLGNSSQHVDRKVATGLLDHLFERSHSPGLNLAALNIQRGRDHGLPSYNAFRRFCGLRNAKRFIHTRKEIPSRRNRRLLAKLYKGNPNLADLWAAGLAEAPVNGGIVGPTFACIIREQFRRIRDGDRFYYKNPRIFTPMQVQEIEKTSLSRILCDNLKSIVSVQPNAFLAGKVNHRRVECGQISGIDLLAWKDNVRSVAPLPPEPEQHWAIWFPRPGNPYHAVQVRRKK